MRETSCASSREDMVLPFEVEKRCGDEASIYAATGSLEQRGSGKHDGKSIV